MIRSGRGNETDNAFSSASVGLVTPTATPQGNVSPTYFATAADFRKWLAKHHATADELIVGFYKKSSGKGGMTYKEAVDEALCFGWIDGMVRRIDDERHQQRYTPRRPGSIWSNVNVRNAERLIAVERMRPAGLAAFQARTAAKTGIYSFEAKQPKQLSATDEKTFRANKKAWAFFAEQAPWYQRKVMWWVASAKQDATRQKRLMRLMTASAARKRV